MNMNYKFVEPYLPTDNSRQVDSISLAKDFINKRPSSDLNILDLGCGAGYTKTIFKVLKPSVFWVGLDIKNSPEIRTRGNINPGFVTFNGYQTPFGNNVFDMVYTNQVFEHVEDPKILIAEINRVLKPGGYLVGSVSQLEPYHSDSIFNFTIYAVCLLFNLYDLKLKEIRPGIDGMTLIIRRAIGGPKCFNRWFGHESPLNLCISLLGKIARWPQNKINLSKLIFCGHICFVAKKADQE